MRMTTATDTHVLTLAQWLSPAFPVGAFTYSHGIERAIQDGRIGSAKDLTGWLDAVLRHGSGRNDAILIRAAYEAAPDAAAQVADMARALAPSRERLIEMDEQGAAFARTLGGMQGRDLPKYPYPVAYAVVGRDAGLPVALMVQMYLQAFASNLVSAAVRLVPLGQTEGQIAVAALTRVCQEVAGATRDESLDDLGSVAFLSDIASLRHETLEPRIFRS